MQSESIFWVTDQPLPMEITRIYTLEACPFWVANSLGLCERLLCSDHHIDLMVGWKENESLMEMSLSCLGILYQIENCCQDLNWSAAENWEFGKLYISAFDCIRLSDSSPWVKSNMPLKANNSLIIDSAVQYYISFGMICSLDWEHEKLQLSSPAKILQLQASILFVGHQTELYSSALSFYPLFATTNY